MKKYCLPALAAAVLLLASCKKETGTTTVPDAPAARDYSRINEMDWLVGRWEHHTEKGYNSEVWEKVNDSVYKGYSYMLKDKDTVSSETVELCQKGDSLYYIPTVANQNNGKPIAFKLISTAGGKFTFENKAHDFPMQISYEKKSNDSLLAVISGKFHDGMKVIEFPMARVK